jgi:hypothetical protein
MSPAADGQGGARPLSVPRLAHGSSPRRHAADLLAASPATQSTPGRDSVPACPPANQAEHLALLLPDQLTERSRRDLAGKRGPDRAAGSTRRRLGDHVIHVISPRHLAVSGQPRPHSQAGRPAYPQPVAAPRPGPAGLCAGVNAIPHARPLMHAILPGGSEPGSTHGRTQARSDFAPTRHGAVPSLARRPVAGGAAPRQRRATFSAARVVTPGQTPRCELPAADIPCSGMSSR